MKIIFSYVLFSQSNHQHNIQLVVEEVMKNDYHSSLVGGPYIFQTKLRHYTVIYPLWCSKVVKSPSLLSILNWLYHTKLLINERAPNPIMESTRSSVVGIGKSSLEYALFKEVYTYVDLTILFLNRDYIIQQSWVLNVTNEVSLIVDLNA